MRHSRILGFLLCTAGALGPLAAGAQTPPDPAGTGAVAGADTEELVVDFNDGASAASMGRARRRSSRSSPPWPSCNARA